MNPSFASRFNIDGGKIDLYSGSLNLKLTILPIPVFKPYITGGGGLARVSSTEARITFDNNQIYKVTPLASQTVSALNAGAGVDLAFGGLTLYAELRVNFVFTDPKTTVQVPIGSVGLTF